MSNLKIFRALISYIGGKRLLSHKIIKHAKGKVFIDAMAGACSMSLLAKHLGFQVKSNDIGKRSYYSQLALIENSEEKISEEDIARLFVPTLSSGFIETNYSPKYFTKQVAKFLDNAFAVIEQIENKHKQALLKHLLVGYILRLRSFSRFGLTQDTKMIEEGKTIELFESSSNSRTKKALMNMQHPFKVLCQIAKDINFAITSGEKCEASNQDVFEFLKTVQGDTVYLDPPYPGSCSYEETYQVLDSILEGKEIRMPVSVFNKKDSEKFFCQLFEACEHVPLILMSCGKNPQADESKDSYEGTELLEIAKKYRPNSELVTFRHKWAINTLASKKQSLAIEYLLICKK